MRRVLFAALIAAASIATPALAQDNFPNKPIRIVLPVPPGSALDIATRAIGEQLASRWGQQVLVEARPGAGGLIAGQAVANAPPDGYTLLGGPSSLFVILPAQKDKLPLDVNRDFVQLGMIVGSGVLFVAVSPKLGVSTLDRIRGAGEIEARPDRDRHQRRRHAAAFRRAGDREEGQRADHGRALQPGWHHGGRGRHHGRARAWHDRRRCSGCAARCSPATSS